MDDSDTSSLSSVAPDEEVQKLAPIFLKAKRATKKVAPPPLASPPRPKRDPSPPHEDAFADNTDIAFIVMFRSRFSSAFPPKLAHLGPQDIERAVCEPLPSSQAEALLCALLGLVLNRKKPVEHGHHGRALEEAVASHKSQWPEKWEGRSPISGSKDFKSMSPEERLNLLRTLIMWSLTSSEEISTMIKDSYKQNRHNDDENQPLSVQPWGRDGDKRRYFLIEGQDDTSFRVYREGPRLDKRVQWYSMAGDIEEIRTLAERLEKTDGTQAARTLSGRMLAAIPRFEATEEKRKRREYRQIRKAQFTRPEPGFSLYEGRTRGKRMRYTFDDEDMYSDDGSVRRSARTSDRDTPMETGPVTTLSGRQVKPRRGGEYGSSLLSGQADAIIRDDLSMATDDSAPQMRSRGARTSARPQPSSKRKFIDDDELDEGLSDEESNGEWDSDANGHDDYEMPDADDEEEEDDDDDEEIVAYSDSELEPRSLVVKLKVSPNPDHFRPLHTTDTKPVHPQPNATSEVSEGGLHNHASAQKHDPPESKQDDLIQQRQETSTYSASPYGSQAQSFAISRSEAYESPSQQQAPAAQTSLSGYPTPASLPPPAFKNEPHVTIESTALSTSSASWPSTVGNGQSYAGPHVQPIRPSNFATVTEHGQ